MIDRSHERNMRPTPVAVYGLADAAGDIANRVSNLYHTQAGKRVTGLRPTDGLACGRCHVNAAGGGARTAFGNAYAANGHKVPSKGAKPGKTSETAPPAAVSPATRPIVLEYVPWTLHDPYYSHFLYSPDDYRK